MDEKKDKRVLNIELDENVKKVSITGLGDDNQVVMAQELSEDDLEQATGGWSNQGRVCNARNVEEGCGCFCIPFNEPCGDNYDNGE